MTNRREFLAGLGGLAGMGGLTALGNSPEEMKTAIAAPGKLNYKVGLGKPSGFSAIDLFTRVDRETITKMFPEGTVPIHIVSAACPTEKESVEWIWGRIEELCREHLKFIFNAGFGERLACFLYVEEVPMDIFRR